MLISKEWLSEFVDLRGKRDEDIAREFTLRVAEVEGVVREGSELDEVCVGVILEVRPHPGADRLRICSVDSGERIPLQIVCGGSNLAVGQKVALAKIGARVQWHGAGDLVTLEPAEIRGVKSEGMICGADEIGLAAQFPKGSEKEILDISHLKAKAGTPLAEALGKNGVLFELDNKALSNRPDLWGLRGLAREFGAVLNSKITVPAPKAFKTKSDIALEIKVEDGLLCPRYEAVVMTGVETISSPVWMQKRLSAAGVRPINAIVDVTNYVMLEGGQPLHAFDFDSVKETEKRTSIFVRKAKPGEKIDALDGRNYELPAGALVIATKKDAIAVAGVIGGSSHSITAGTKTVVIESANFNASSIRQTSTRMHLRTESSSRFEKGLDPNNTEWGLARAVELLQQIFPQARVVSKVVDVKRVLPKPRTLDLSQEDLDRAIGVGVKLSAAKKILEQLGFVCKGSAKKLRVGVPTSRLKDVIGTHDLVEEVVRLHGYEKLPSTLPTIQLRNITENPVVALQYKIKELCAYRHGFTEVNTYAYVRPQTAALFGIAEENLIELANPLSSERPFLAPTLAMNLAEVVEKNQRVRDEVAVFEIAKVFRADEFIVDASKKAERNVPFQPVQLGIALSGKKNEQGFARVREAVISSFGELGYTLSVRRPGAALSWWQSGHAAEFVFGEIVVGYVAVLNPTVRNKMGIENETVIAEINLTELLSRTPVSRQYTKATAFQSSVRDVAVSVAENISADQLLETVYRSHPLVHAVEIFDIYHASDKNPDWKGKKSVAFHVTFLSDDHTLKTEEIDLAHSYVVSALEKKCGAQLR